MFWHCLWLLAGQCTVSCVFAGQGVGETETWGAVARRPQEGWSEEQIGQRWGMVSPMGRKGHTPTRVFKQVDQASFF